MTVTAMSNASAPHAFTAFTPMEYLMIDIASNFGLDKADWADRIQWTQENEAQLESLLNKADEPALYFAAVQAYRKAQKGLPTGYPISLDATASGLQLLACLTGCEASARLCNVVPTGHREDAYANIHKAMNAGVVTREQAKHAVMTSLYGSTAVPKRHFGEGELLELFYKTMETQAPGAWMLNKVLISLWQEDAFSHDWILPDNFHVHVKVITDVAEFVQFQDRVVMVNLKVNQPTKDGLSLGANTIHSIDGMVVREIHRRCDYDQNQVLRLLELISKVQIFGKSRTREKDELVQILWKNYQDSGFLSARILDVLDEQNMGLVDISRIKDLLLSLPEKPFKVISIHDCFRVHPNYGNDLRQQYLRILSEIAGSELLSFIMSQILKSPVTIQKAGDISQQILSSDYALS